MHRHWVRITPYAIADIITIQRPVSIMYPAVITILRSVGLLMLMVLYPQDRGFLAIICLLIALMILLIMRIPMAKWLQLQAHWLGGRQPVVLMHGIQ